MSPNQDPDPGSNFRKEYDSMGEVHVPATAHYGSQTQRAVDNFGRSGLQPPIQLIHALASVKAAAAKINHKLNQLDEERSLAIEAAAKEIAQGLWDDQFVVDLFQTGSGTSTNMNMNEVIASIANEALTGKRGGREPVHPNDHVNLGQSSNDLIPTALHFASVLDIHQKLLPALDHLHGKLKARVVEFELVRKIGRTHLQDAVPMTLGQAFGGFARQIQLGGDRIRAVLTRLTELALGGTAVGNGINTHPRFASMTIEALSDATGIVFREAENHFEAQGSRDAAVETSGSLKTVAVGLIKISNDIRWMGSGPRCGIGELRLPSLQPGSSIMPGKVNPVIPEAVIQMAYQVAGNDAAIALAGQSGNFELNVTLPLIAHNLLQSIGLVSHGARLLADKCIAGLEADRDQCEGYIEQSLALVTALVPHIGYDRAAELAKEAYNSGRTVRQVALSKKVLPEDTINQLLG
jgi:fumarate hydratase class II